MKKWLLIIFVLMFVGSVLAEAPVVPAAGFKPLCWLMAWFNIGEPFEWSQTAYQRGELPNKVQPIGYVYLTDPSLPDEQVQLIHIEYAPDWDQVVIFPYWSLRWSTGPNGEDPGTHDFCDGNARRLWLPALVRTLLKQVMLP